MVHTSHRLTPAPRRGGSGPARGQGVEVASPTTQAAEGSAARAGHHIRSGRGGGGDARGRGDGGAAGGRARGGGDGGVRLSAGRGPECSFFSILFGFLFPFLWARWGEGGRGALLESIISIWDRIYGRVKNPPPLLRQRDIKYEITHTHRRQAFDSIQLHLPLRREHANLRDPVASYTPMQRGCITPLWLPFDLQNRGVPAVHPAVREA